MIATVIAFLTLVAAITIGIIQIRAAQRPKKDIRCRLVASVPLLKVVDDRFKGDLQVTFHGKVIEDPYSIVLRVYNAGKLPIIPTDFVRPIIFMFSSGTEILNAEVLNTEPHNLGAKLEIRKDNNSIGIELQPLLMNSGDSIDISTVVASFDNNLIVDGRVVGATVRPNPETKINDGKITPAIVEVIAYIARNLY